MALFDCKATSSQTCVRFVTPAIAQNNEVQLREHPATKYGNVPIDGTLPEFASRGAYEKGMSLNTIRTAFPGDETSRHD